MKLRIRNPLIEGEPDEIRAATAAKERADVIRAARRQPWTEFAADELERHRAVYLDDANDRVLEVVPDVWVRGDMLRSSPNEALVVGWFVGSGGAPVFLREAQHQGPKTATAYREAITQKRDSSAPRWRRPVIAPPAEPLPEGVNSIFPGRVGGKQIEPREDEVRARRLQAARSIEEWTEIEPAQRIIRRGPFLVDSETDFVYTRRAGRIFDTGRATIAYATPDTPLAFYTDESGELIFLERYTGAATWSDIYARQVRRGHLRPVP